MENFERGYDVLKEHKAKQSLLVVQFSRLLLFGIALRSRSYLLVCAGLWFPFISPAAEHVDCIKQPSDEVVVSGQSDRFRMCALIGIWDTIITGNNRHRYSGEVVAWVDDSVSSARAAIHNLDLLQCASLDPSVLAQATLLLVTQISDKDFDKNKVKYLELASGQKAVSNVTAKPLCESVEAKYPGKHATFTAGISPKYFQSSNCAFEDLKLPDEFAVYAAGAYSGRRTGFQIDQSGHEGTQIDIAVNHTKPVVLMLGAYEPTIWNIGWTPHTKIVAVIASGYHRQIIAGLKGSIPVLISSYDNHGACGYFYVDIDKLASLNPLSRRLFNRQVDMVYPAQDGKVLVGESIPAGVKLVTSTSAMPDTFHDTSAPLAGQAGLEDAVEKGGLRKATPKDAEAWAKAVIETSPKRDEPPVKGIEIPSLQLPRLYHAYVVLKPFTYPAGLYGANMATFFIPKGIIMPKGNPGHSAIYDFNTMDCQGALCGR